MADSIVDLERFGIDALRVALLGFAYPKQRDHLIDSLKKAFNLIEMDKKHYSKKIHNEDSISSHICNMLRMAGFESNREQHSNGHVDIFVQLKYAFLIESKIHKSYKWTQKGVRQVTSEYATGNELDSAVLLFVWNKDLQSVIRQTMEKIVPEGRSFLTVEPKHKTFQFENISGSETNLHVFFLHLRYVDKDK